MSLEEIMHEPTFIRENATVEDAARLMAEKSIGSVIVGSAENALGIFSERDLLVKIVARNVDARKAKVRDYMTSPIMAIDISMSVFDAQDIMTERHIRRLPIADNGRIVGIMSARTLMEHLRYEYILRKSVDSSQREVYTGYW